MGQNFKEDNQHAGDGQEEKNGHHDEHHDRHETICVELIINGRPKTWDKKKISYEEIIEIAFGKGPIDPNTIYTVTYLKGPKENPSGTLTKGHSVFVKNEMIINATPTIKS